MLLSTGTQLGRYEILALIRESGIGEVYNVGVNNTFEAKYFQSQYLFERFSGQTGRVAQRRRFGQIYILSIRGAYVAYQ